MLPDGHLFDIISTQCSDKYWHIYGTYSEVGVGVYIYSLFWDGTESEKIV